MNFFSFTDPNWGLVDNTSEFFSQIDPVDGHLSLGPHVLLYKRELPIYENTYLLFLTSEEWDKGLAICYLVNKGNIFRLNGSSPPIHEVNAKAPIKITEENVLFYLSFFCFFVHGEEGPFYILHDLNDQLLPEEFTDPQSENEAHVIALRKVFRSPRLFGRSDKGHWRASTLIYYSNAIFLADFAIHPTGMVEMLKDEPLMADLPCRIETSLDSRLRIDDI